MKKEDTWLGIGVAVGVALGVATKNLAIGIALGVILGIAMRNYAKRKNGKNDNDQDLQV